MSAESGVGPDARLLALAAMHCRPGAARLSDDALATELAALPGWERAGAAIRKTFRFADYRATIAFVNAVASIAHEEDHHPVLSVHYDRCEVTYSTHSAGGVTQSDCICAARVLRLPA
jgi:4a-hydroxytetrahydrobiopterin dehydratase